MGCHPREAAEHGRERKSQHRDMESTEWVGAAGWGALVIIMTIKFASAEH